MYYELFIDVFFATNLVMDYFLLRLVNRLLHCSATQIRSLAGGAFGALSVSLLIAMGMLSQKFLNTILVHVVINTIMVKFGCKIKDWHKLLQGLLLLYLASFLTGGLLMVMRRYFSRTGFWFFLFLAATGYLIITAAILVYARLKGKGTNLYEIVLYAGTNCRKVTGFCDTGFPRLAGQDSLAYSVQFCSCVAASFNRAKLSLLMMCSIRQASASAILGSTPAAISCSVKKQWRS